MTAKLLNSASDHVGIRLAVIISHPIQHFAPLFRAIAKAARIQVRVFYCCDWGVNPYHDAGFGSTFSWDIPLLEGYEYEFVPIRRRPEKLGFWDVDNPTVGAHLSKFAPQFIWLHGYSHRTIWRAAHWANGRASLIQFGDSELVHPRSWWRKALKRTVLRRHFQRCDAFITIGDNNELYYRHYGVPDCKMFRGAYPIDLERFNSTIHSPNRISRAEIRNRHRIPLDAVLALHVGKLVDRKRPGHFVDAIGRVCQKEPRLHGLIVGDGPLRSDVEKQIRDLGLDERVRISGFVNQRDIPLILDAGDFLVSTSEIDAHPLVITESLAAGLPIVASDRIGCVGPTDTARSSVNALTYRYGHIDELAQQISRLVESADMREMMAGASLKIAVTQDVSVTAQAVFRAIDYINNERSCNGGQPECDAR